MAVFNHISGTLGPQRCFGVCRGWCGWVGTGTLGTLFNQSNASSYLQG